MEGDVIRMTGSGVTSSRLDMICGELAKYGIAAVPSADRPSWLVVNSPSTPFSDRDAWLRGPSRPEVFVSDLDLMRIDCVELVLDKVTSVVGHPC
jgi:hypothetical protein